MQRTDVAPQPDGGLRQRLVAPAIVGLGGAVATAAVALRDPHVAGNWGAEGVGLCPFLALTGLWCPLCGGLRAVHSLTALDLPAAVSANVVVVGMVVAAVAAWGAWVVAETRGHPLSRDVGHQGGRLARALQSSAASRVGALALVIFTVLRNLPVGAALAP